MIKVEWDHKVCIHSANCVKKLPNGIQVENGQFVIDETGSSEDRQVCGGRMPVWRVKNSRDVSSAVPPYRRYKRSRRCRRYCGNRSRMKELRRERAWARDGHANSATAEPQTKKTAALPTGSMLETFIWRCCDRRRRRRREHRPGPLVAAERRHLASRSMIGRDRTSASPMCGAKPAKISAASPRRPARSTCRPRWRRRRVRCSGGPTTGCRARKTARDSPGRAGDRALGLGGGLPDRMG
jgi:uncharacterized Fe-S cluster protein YjdI